VLLKHKADPNRRVTPSNEQARYTVGPGQSLGGPGITPLHIAALSGQTNGIPLLLKAGASINATNSTGRIALDLVSFQPMGPAMFWMRRGFSTSLNPPGIGERDQPGPPGMFPQQRRAVAASSNRPGPKRSAAGPAGSWAARFLIIGSRRPSETCSRRLRN